MQIIRQESSQILKVPYIIASRGWSSWLPQKHRYIYIKNVNTQTAVTWEPNKRVWIQVKKKHIQGKKKSPKDKSTRHMSARQTLWDEESTLKHIPAGVLVMCYSILSLRFPLLDVFACWLSVWVRFHVWKSKRAWLSFSIQSSLSCLVSAENQHLKQERPSSVCVQLLVSSLHPVSGVTERCFPSAVKNTTPTVTSLAGCSQKSNVMRHAHCKQMWNRLA